MTTDGADFSLAGKTIVVTGGGGLLGSEMVHALAAAGAHAVALDLKFDEAVFASRPATAGAITKLHADITDPTSVAAARNEIERTCGLVTGLVNNAAAKSKNFFEPFETFPIEDWNAVMGVNVTGAMVCSQVFGSAMAERGTGAIVNILSIYGIVAPDQRIYEGSSYLGRPINTPAVYSASKAALWGMTKYLAAYWGDKKIRVNAISPGGVFSGQNDTFSTAYSKRVPLGRMADRTEMSGALIFLLSDASSYVTGQNLMVDGGLSVW